MHIDQEIEIFCDFKSQNLFIANNIHAGNDTVEIVDYSDGGLVFTCNPNSKAKAKTQSRAEEEENSQKEECSCGVCI